MLETSLWTSVALTIDRSRKLVLAVIARQNEHFRLASSVNIALAAAHAPLIIIVDVSTLRALLRENVLLFIFTVHHRSPL
jgi:hypothetical protein